MLDDDGGSRDDDLDRVIAAQIDDDLALLLAAPELWGTVDDPEDRIVAAITDERAAAAFQEARWSELDDVRRRRSWSIPAAAAIAGASIATLITLAVAPRRGWASVADRVVRSRVSARALRRRWLRDGHH